MRSAASLRRFDKPAFGPSGFCVMTLTHSSIDIRCLRYASANKDSAALAKSFLETRDAKWPRKSAALNASERILSLTLVPSGRPFSLVRARE